MDESFEVVIVGLGATGSAAAYHSARRGKRILGLDRFTPPHSFGSSHGQTRIIRQAYFEHPLYVPLVRQAYERWAELERESGRTLFRQTGGVMIGPPDGILTAGAQLSARLHDLPHEVLSAAETRQRFPALRPTDEMVAVWEPEAGILFPEACVEVNLELARRRGAVLKFEEPVVTWRPDGEGVRVITSEGQYQCSKLLLTAGAWTPHLVADLNLPLTIERQATFWFRPRGLSPHLGPEGCPISIWEYEPGRYFYAFPDLGEGVKIACHHEGEVCDADTVPRAVKQEEIETVRSLARRFIPEADGPLRNASVCLYTNTPDFHFLIDFHPLHPQVLIASPCSGHGFKFASAIGEVLADLLVEGHTVVDIHPFRIGRFG